MKVRIIAKLDVKPPNVVKPVHFEGLRRMGAPFELAKKYYLEGADEVFYIDIVSSLYQRNILFEEVEKAANELFIPFGVGGAIRSVDDISKLFHLGADKVAINTYVVQEDASLINRAAEIFGNQAIVVNIEAKRWNSWWECYTDCGRIRSGKDVIAWAKEAEERGAGEILLQSVDQDGRRRGFDLELCKQVVNAVDIPVVVASGAGALEDIREVVEYASPSGVAVASLLHYDIASIGEIKRYLNESGIEVSK